jgi:hypothetical protein
MLFERAFDLVHVIAVPIRHVGKNSIAARSRVTKDHVRNTGDYFPNAE